jgi:WD40 repeat protein
MLCSTSLMTPFVMFLFATSLAGERLYIVHSDSMAWIDPTTGVPGPVWIGGGTDYDLAISPDGRTLYHLSGEQLAFRDARTLQPFHYNHAPFTFEIPHRLHWILPARPSIAISNSGTSLYMLKLYSSSSEEDAAVATFDTQREVLLPEEAHLSECQGATLIPLHEERHLLIICGGDSVLHFLQLGNNGSVVSDFVLSIPPVPVKSIPGPRVGRQDREESFVQSALTTDGSTLLLAKWDGRAVKVDIASRQVIAATALPLPNTRIMSSTSCLSHDGTVWHLAGRNPTNYGEGNERIVGLDTRSLAVVSTMTPTQPFWSMAISPDGQRLYTTEPRSPVIHVMSTETGKEVRAFGTNRENNRIQTRSAFLVAAP